MSKLAPVLSAGVWPLAVLAVAVAVVTVVALLRAPREDASEVFASFGDAFGIHPRLRRRRAASSSKPKVRASGDGLAQNENADPATEEEQ